MILKLPQQFTNLTINAITQNICPFIVKDIATQREEKLLYIASNESSASYIYKILQKLLPKYDITLFPAWDNIAYDRISPTNHIINRRLYALNKIINSNSKKQIIITTVKAALTKIIPQTSLQENIFHLTKNAQINREELINFLIRNSYIRVDTVTNSGEFAVKGSLIDIFPGNETKPLRLDFFGDSLESIKYFNPLTQITLNNHPESITLIPAKEIIFSQENIENFKKNYLTFFSVNDNSNLLFESTINGHYYDGIENYLPLFYNQLETIFSYFDKGIIITDNLFLESMTNHLEEIKDHYETRKSLLLKEKNDNPYNPIPPELLYLDLKSIEKEFTQNKNIKFSSFDSDPNFSLSAACKNIPDFAKESKARSLSVMESLKKYLQTEAKNYENIIIATFNEHSQERLKKLLNDHDITVQILEEFPTKPSKIISLITLPISRGFKARNILLISEQDILGNRINRNIKSKKADKFLLERSSLTVGEHVVHNEYGIAQFIGLKTLSIHEKEHDFLTLIYAKNDKLYVPVENISLISRYGQSHENIRLDSLGSGNWQERRAKLKKRIEDIAATLIKTAGLRATKTAEKFISNESLAGEFAAKFPYDETEDQLKAIRDIEEDLAKGKPMDRLICGDVGFGKTEIAMRATFIVLTKPQKIKPQIALIVPTTLLSRQHFNNFKERFSGFGFTIKQLSRMVTAKEARETKQLLAEGKVDIVIGTHALLAKDIKFKNLNLIIVDEEQHFGVTQKEKLKTLQADLHLLTLSATPIPRTLQMSLNGIKDLSLITTPPVDRIAVRSHVMPFDKMIIREAILREFNRNGRIFYVCPKIKDLDKEADKLLKLVPEIKIVKAHGKMTTDQLDKIMNDFYNGEYDLLLSTSIVESGLDVPTANTIIVHRADMFGLSQLYQLRGRVGRSKIRAYAYFTVPTNHVLTDNARKRLDIMQTLDGLGAGFSLASYDMDIRGAGNLLGQQQSGDIKEVGIELYQKMLQDEIAKNKQENEIVLEDKFIPTVNLDISILIPEKYITDISVRMEFYRRIGDVLHAEEVTTLRYEMEDRFGTVPSQVNNLFDIVLIKQKALQCQIEKIDTGPKGTVLTLYKNEFPKPDKLIEYIFKHRATAKIRPDQKIFFSQENIDTATKINNVNQILNDLLELVA